MAERGSNNEQGAIVLECLQVKGGFFFLSFSLATYNVRYSSSEFNEPPLTGEYRTRTSTGRLAIMDS